MSATSIHRTTTGITNGRTPFPRHDDVSTTPISGGESMSMDDPEATEPTLEGGYDPDAVETRWQQRWVDEETYAYEGEPGQDPNTTYAIDTPPPTVSGSLHMGHLYGSTLQDFAARFQRMANGDVLFPFGYDDNGIASERLTEKELDIRHQDYERREFQELCREVCTEYEAEFTDKMQSLGTSIDWSHTYKTIEPRVQRISQLSFIDLYEKDREYRKKAPAIWCPECETAISQVETEDDERHAHFNDIAFELASDGTDREEFVISTTRPELIPACVSVFVHPDDEANGDLVGETARVPIFGHEVPVIADERVDMEKGSGIVMCCTFGDQKDIEWYQAHDLPLRVAIDETATMTDLAGDYEGLSTEEAREAIVEDLDDDGYLRDRREIVHDVGVHERCDTPVEYRVSKQWYVEVLDHKAEYLEAGQEMDWYPEKMFTRYEHWIEGLEWDWLISRQRDSGIPFPVWYCRECDHEILAEKEDLPVDPLSDEPPVDTCPECGNDEFVPEEDVFDTWATSSLTPLINAGWDWDADDEAFTMENPELYPFDLRPQGHDIISFWLFHTVIKCYEHTGEVPFDATMINGHVLDENREKMSKSRGNVVEPDAVLSEYPVDAVRFWAASAAVGDDFPYQEKDLTAGEKLLRKLWNASKLVDTLAPRDPDEPETLEAIDRWLLAELDDAVTDLTAHLEDYEFAKARDRLRTFFWNTFCDDYLEIAKTREDEPSTQYALRTAHRTFLELWAPFLPHVTEEIWQAVYAADAAALESIHTREWPTPKGYEADLEAGETAMEVISALRRYKSENQLPLNADLESVSVYGPIEGFEGAIQHVMHVQELSVLEAEPEVATEVASIDLDYSTLGPKFGSKVGEIDAGIDSGEYEIDDDAGVLRVAGEELEDDLFEVSLERTYSGDGEMIETESAVVILQHD
ncbi:valine--tRNA ligase [Natronorubrum bangense]|uniref:Valine--tRNA ligase n=2 Tax=Natronorubrum bangense TaxID=61858 RepID=L9WGF3_9EURY|nr:valine--tRNA ligase [Natronorubrum bangense]ELY48514.1 valyl-tRNA ligase [Natronorubrum bangense JCM 10635]QCC53811.1 valine--tRNA ligase [Natronorubrum bangense]